MPEKSPELSALQGQLDSGNKAALVAFWDKIAREGAPLIESAGDDENLYLVTFLWRSNDASSVALVSMMTRPADQEMIQLPNTDLWYKTLHLQNDIRATYQFSPVDLAAPKDAGGYGAAWANWRSDPYNPHTFSFFDEEDPEDTDGVRLVRSILTMPDAPPQPWLKSAAGNQVGNIELQHINSQILGNTRRVWVYTPSGYMPENEVSYPVLVLFDGWSYLKLMPTLTILNNLIRAGQIPPLIVVLVDSLGVEERIRELILHQPFNDFLANELMPWLRERYPVAIDPKNVVVGGASAGGLAAAYAALEYPNIFGNVLSQSGAHAFSPPGQAEYGWLARQFAERDILPIKFYLDVGILETNSLRDRGDMPSTLAANRHLRTVLLEKGYQVLYVEFPGGHDYISWQGTFGDGLAALIGNASGE